MVVLHVMYGLPVLITFLRAFSSVHPAGVGKVRRMTDPGADSRVGVGFDTAMIGVEPLDEGDPRRVGEIQLRGVLGSGGMGRVFLGLTPDGYAAVKRVLPALATDNSFLIRFGQELDNQARLPTGVSARLLASNRTARPPWFATEYIPGVTLHEAVHLAGGRLPVETVWGLLRELAARLNVLSRLGLVHRDLKPSNVMLTADGVTLIDFGVARAVDQSQVTTTGKVIGTPAYMSPEQASGIRQLTPAADVFSLGGVIFFAATGQPPFGDGSMDVLYRIVHQQPDLGALRELDPALADIVESCLAKEPLARPATGMLAEAVAKRAMAGVPVWPEHVAVRIAVRRAFADAAPVHELDATAREAGGRPGSAAAVPAPRASVEAETIRAAGRPGAAGGAGPGASSASAQPDDPRSRRRPRRMVVLLLPLVLAVGTGATLAMVPLPFASTPHASGGPKTSTSATVESGVSGAVGHSSLPSPLGSRSSDAAPGGGAPGASTVPSAGSEGLTGENPTASSVPATHTSVSSDPAVVSSISSLLKNVASGQCLSSAGSYAGLGPAACSTSTGSEGWKAVYSGSTFEIVNLADGDCLTGQGSNYTILFPCGRDGGQHWRIGTHTAQGGSLENADYPGTCLEYVFNGEMTPSCNAADTGQLWYGGGRVS